MNLSMQTYDKFPAFLKISQKLQELACNFIFENLPFIKGSNFSHKKGGVGKIEGCLKKGYYFHTKPFQCYLSLIV